MNDTTLPPPPTVIAYAAGFFDGEGSVFINRRRGKADGGPNRGSTQHLLFVSIAGTVRDPLDVIRDAFGGSVCIDKHRAMNRRKVFRLTMVARTGARFLSLTLPFLTVKKRAAELAVEFQTEKDNRVGWNGAPSAGQLMRREWFKQAISNLNHLIEPDRWGPDSAYPPFLQTLPVNERRRRRPVHARGAGNGRACLTESDVLHIARELRAGTVKRHLAARFRVSACTIGDIAKGRTWRHLDLGFPLST